MGNPYRIKSHKRIYRRSLGSILLRGGAIAAGGLLLFGLGWALYGPISRFFENGVVEEGGSQVQEQPAEEGLEMVPEEGAKAEGPSVQPTEPEQPAQQPAAAAKTAYLPTETVLDGARFPEVLAAVKAQGYDSVMITLKEQDGTVNYPISYRAELDGLYTGEAAFDLAQTARQIQEAGLIPMAAVYAFEDRKYPSADNSSGVYYKGTDYLWLDDAPENGGRSWLNPYSPGAQAYLEKILADAVGAGFQELVLFSFQFPVGYSMEMMDFGQVTQGKQELLAQYGAKLEQWAAGQGAILKVALPAVSMLGGDSRGYGGDSRAIATGSTVVEASPSSFGGQFITEELNLPQPQVDGAATVQAAAQAVQRKLGGDVTIMVSGGEVAPAALEQAGIGQYIIVGPVL